MLPFKASSRQKKSKRHCYPVNRLCDVNHNKMKLLRNRNDINASIHSFKYPSCYFLKPLLGPSYGLEGKQNKNKRVPKFSVNY